MVFATDNPAAMTASYSVATRGQGANSSSHSRAARSCALADSVRGIRRKMRSPFPLTLAPPSRISPQLMSMSSAMRLYIAVLVASFRLGAGLQPKQEPSPVVKPIILAPLPPLPVTDTGS